MAMQKGCISIDTENIFPIIKKWLYSDKDNFIRELISNGCDAISKYKRLVSLGEVKQSEDEKYKITVSHAFPLMAQAAIFIKINNKGNNKDNYMLSN